MGGSVWVANSGDGTVEVDPRTLEVVQTVGIGAQATNRRECRRRLGGDWKRQHARPDAPANRGRPRGVALPQDNDQPTTAPAVAVGEGAVWVGSGIRLPKVDPDSGTIVAGLSQLGFGHGVIDIAVGLGAVWIADQQELVVRISRETATPTGKPVRSVYPSSLAVGYGSVWVAGADYGGSHPAL